MSKNIYGIIGHPVEHSLSPAMFEAAFKAKKIEAQYELFDIDPDKEDDLANFCYESDINEIKGLSVTMPFKEVIMDYCDYYDSIAKQIGSVNTIKNDASNLNGYNTDATGAIQAIQEVESPAGKKCLIIGAGGAARAIAYSLKEFGAEVYIWNRTPERAKVLAKELDIEPIEFNQIQGHGFDVVVNTTPVGMSPQIEQCLLKAEHIKKEAIVMDVITNPLETELLKEAKKAGARTISGERMLLHQATGQFEIWFDETAPIDAMEKALYQALEKKRD